MGLRPSSVGVYSGTGRAAPSPHQALHALPIGPGPESSPCPALPGRFFQSRLRTRRCSRDTLESRQSSPATRGVDKLDEFEDRQRAGRSIFALPPTAAFLTPQVSHFPCVHPSRAALLGWVVPLGSRCNFADPPPRQVTPLRHSCTFAYLSTAPRTKQEGGGSQGDELGKLRKARPARDAGTAGAQQVDAGTCVDAGREEQGGTTTNPGSRELGLTLAQSSTV